MQLNRTNNCMNTEFTNIIQPIMNSVENEGDLLTNIFIVTQLNTIVCKTTREINKINMKDAGSVLLDGLQELAKNFAMNKNRIDLIRVMLGLIKRRSIVMFPYENMTIIMFINFLDGKIPQPMSQRNQLRERLITLLGLKTVLRKLKRGIWRKSIKAQKRQFKNIDQEIRSILRSTDVQQQGWEYTDGMESLETNMMAAFQGIDIETMDMSLLMDMMAEY